MSTFRGARKFTTNRKQELQFQRELEAIRSKALVDRYAREVAELRAVGGTAPLMIDGSGTPNQPTVAQKPSTTSAKNALLEHGHKSTSQRSSNMQAKPGQEKASPPQKRFAKPKFAIVSALKTSAPIKYAEREPRTSAKVQSLAQNPTLMPGEDANTARPVSQATSRGRSRASETSYQRQIVSQAEYLGTESSATVDPSTPLLDQPSLEKPRKGGRTLAYDSSLLQSASTMASIPHDDGKAPVLQSPDRFLSTEEEDSASHVSLMSDRDRVRTSVSVQAHGQNSQYPGAQVPHPNSGILKLDIDLRFDATEQPNLEVDACPSAGQLQHISSSDMSVLSEGSAPESLASTRDDATTHGESHEVVDAEVDQSEEAFEDEEDLVSASQLMQQGQSLSSDKFHSLPCDSLSSIMGESTLRDDSQPARPLEATAMHLQNSTAQNDLSEPPSKHLLGTSQPSQLQPIANITVVKDSLRVSSSEEDKDVPSSEVSSHSRPADASSSTLLSDSLTGFSTPFTGSLSSLGAPFSLPSGSQGGPSTVDRGWDTNSYSSTVTSSKEGIQKDLQEVLSPDLGSGEFFPSSGNVLPPAVTSSEQLAATTSYFFASMPSAVKSSTMPCEDSSVWSMASGQEEEGSSQSFLLHKEFEKAQEREDMRAKSSQVGMSTLAMPQASGAPSEDSSKPSMPQASLMPDTACASENAREYSQERQSMLEASPSLHITVVKSAAEDTLVPSDLDSAVNEGVADVPQDQLAAFLAFTEGPVTVEDIMSVHGKAVRMPSHVEREGESLMKPESTMSVFKATTLDDTKGGTVDQVQPGNMPTSSRFAKDQNIVFLSTLPTGISHAHSTLHATGTGHNSIHHFCTKPLQPEFPLHLQVLSRKAHTQGSPEKTTLVPPAPHSAHHPGIPAPPSTPGPQAVVVSKRKRTERKSHVTVSHPDESRKHPGQVPRVNVQKSRQSQPVIQANHYSADQLHVSGVKVAVVKDPGSLLWTPAPPKLSLHPATIQSHLFPDYSTAPRKRTTKQDECKVTHPEKEKKIELGSEAPRQRLLGVQSVPEFSKLKDYMQREADGPTVPNATTQQLEIPLQVVQGKREPAATTLEAVEQVGVAIPDSDSLNQDPTATSLRSSQQKPSSSQSTPRSYQASKDCAPEEIDKQGVPTKVNSFPILPTQQEKGEQSNVSTKRNDYYVVMAELDQQREQLDHFHRIQREKKKVAEEESGAPSSSLLDYSQSLEAGSSFLGATSSHTSRRFQRQALKGTRQKAGTAGRHKTLRRTRSALLRAQRARELLSEPPRQLQRSFSFPLFKGELAQLSPQKVMKDPRAASSRNRRLSEPRKKDFLAFMKSRGVSPDATAREWAHNLWWNEWFPEVLHECRVAVAEVCSERELRAILGDSADLTKLHTPKKKRITVRYAVEEKKPAAKEADYESETPMPAELSELENIDPPPVLESSEVEELQQEIMQVSELVHKSEIIDPNLLAVHLCRRGAILRKIGRLREAKEDLDKAIELSPMPCDAYWHRHLLHLVQSNQQLALEDLTRLLKHNRKHWGAHRSRAALLSKEGDLISAIFPLSQAISLRPKDPQSYFLRGELHQKRGEIESAVSDFAMVTKLDPGNLEAFKRQAMHRFNQGLWSQAIQHLSALIQRVPSDTSARIYRSRAYYNMGNYTETLQDLSAVIHLDPGQSEAYYNRACLLRAHHPQQALKDFSVSLLLDDSPANVQACVQRGILYTQLNSFDEALADFESALRLDPSLPSAHVCAGLIHLLHKHNTVKAVKCFTMALVADPTCIRAYLCRAEAYKRDQNYKMAILDYTRAIHIQPDNATVCIYNGEMYLKLGEYDLATLHIRKAAQLNMGFDKSRRQGALVESFLGNHDEALSLLSGLPQVSETHSLRGKLYLRAEELAKAADSFQEAIAAATTAAKSRRYTSSSIDPQASSRTLSELHFLRGQSLSQSGLYRDAVEEFSTVLQLNPDHHLAYYERGVSKLKMGNSKGVLDLNKALAVNPQLFQAFLTRAAYYGKSGRFSKAILNCNEAIRLVPTSVRAYLYRGCLKYQMKSYASAVADFTMATELDPAHSDLALFNRAISYQAMGQLTKAISDFSAALLIQEVPDLKVLVNRGLLYSQLEDHSKALLDFGEAGKQVKNDPAIYQAIGYSYHRLGLLQSAVEAYSEALHFDPSLLEAYVGRGNVYMDYLTQEGNEKSKADYKHALELSPGHLPATVNLSLVLQAEGRCQSSWDCLTEALGRDASFAPALEARAVVSLQMGNLFGALLDINAALKSCPTAKFYTNRGVIHQFMGDTISAMKDYQQATNVDPEYPLAHFNAGNILFHQRHFKGAITCYTHALVPSSSGGDEDDSVLVNRAIAYVMLGDTDRALQDFERAIAVNPHAAHTYFNRGNLHRSLRDYHAAELDYRSALELQPNDWLTLYYHGEVLGLLGRAEEASECYRKAAQLEIP